MESTVKFLIPDEVHQEVILKISRDLGFNMVITYELDQEGKLWARHAKGFNINESSYFSGRLPEPDEIIDSALKERREQIVLYPHNDARCHPAKIKFHSGNPFAVVPIEKNNKIAFLVSVNNKEASALCPDKIKILSELTLSHALDKDTNIKMEEFFGIPIPVDIKKKNTFEKIYRKLNQKQIMELIDFTPPFLRIDKMIISDVSKDSVLGSTSLGMGVITPQDTTGHYNESIFLAMCGWLMASSASIHIAALFPTKAPQVIEASGVKPLITPENSGIWKPSTNGTTFFVETTIVKKKLQLVVVRTTITFGKILFGTIELLKLILTEKSTLQLIREIPET